MKVEFRDKDDNILTLTDFVDFDYHEAPSSNDFKTNNRILERFATDGGYEIGDGTIDPRSGNVGLTFSATSDRIYRLYANRISSFFRPEQAPFYIVDTDNQLRQKISYSGINSGYSHGQEMRFVKHEIKYIAIDPFWESITPITTTINGITNGQTFDVIVADTNPVSPNYNITVYEAYPIIAVTTLSNNVNFAVTNNTNNGSFNIVDSSFTAGQTVTVNGEDGTIKKGNVINSRILAGGRPFKLKSGTNTLLYQTALGALVNIVITHRNRYLY